MIDNKVGAYLEAQKKKICEKQAPNVYNYVTIAWKHVEFYCLMQIWKIDLCFGEQWQETTF
jgi:hypothetical protein